MDFPAAPATEVAVPDGLAEALNAKPDTAYRTGALGDLLAVFSDEASVRALVPDGTAIRTTVDGDRVHLTGHAVTVLDGILHSQRRI